MHSHSGRLDALKASGGKTNGTRSGPAGHSTPRHVGICMALVLPKW